MLMPSPASPLLLLTFLFLEILASSFTQSFIILKTEHNRKSGFIGREMANNNRCLGDPHVQNILFIECGFGNDSHGQDPTKAAVRACRNAIEFNSIPSIKRLVPGGYDSLKLDVLLAIPPKYQDSLNIDTVADVFPYGSIRFQIQDGGMIAPSGIAIEKLGDRNDDMVVVCAAVTVGH